MARVSKNTKNDVLKELRQMILTQVLAPGADLDEVSLAARWSLSRTPMRDVLRQLAGEGYVDIRENRGARVAEMSHRSLRDFFLAAPMIYGAVLRLAAQNATDGQLAQLCRAQETFKSGVDRRRCGSARPGE